MAPQVLSSRGSAATEGSLEAGRGSVPPSDARRLIFQSLSGSVSRRRKRPLQPDRGNWISGWEAGATRKSRSTKSHLVDILEGDGGGPSGRCRGSTEEAGAPASPGSQSTGGVARRLGSAKRDGGGEPEPIAALRRVGPEELGNRGRAQPKTVALQATREVAAILAGEHQLPALNGLPNHAILAGGILLPAAPRSRAWHAGDQRTAERGGVGQRLGLPEVLRQVPAIGPRLEPQAGAPGVLRPAAQPAVADAVEGAHTAPAAPRGAGGTQWRPGCSTS